MYIQLHIHPAQLYIHYDDLMPNTKNRSIRFADDLWERAGKATKAQGENISAVLNDMLESYVVRYETEVAGTRTPTAATVAELLTDGSAKKKAGVKKAAKSSTGPANHCAHRMASVCDDCAKKGSKK